MQTLLLVTPGMIHIPLVGITGMIILVLIYITGRIRQKGFYVAGGQGDEDVIKYHHLCLPSTTSQTDPVVVTTIPE